jgi:hypothetical protein
MKREIKQINLFTVSAILIASIGSYLVSQSHHANINKTITSQRIDIDDYLPTEYTFVDENGTFNVNYPYDGYSR